MSDRKSIVNKLQNFGGQGDTPPGELSRSDMKMIERALKREWNLPDVVLEALPSKVANIFQSEQNTRNRLSAAKILLNMIAENRETAKLAIAYHGLGAESQAGVTVANNIGVEVSQKLTTQDVQDVVNELARMGLVTEQNPAPDLCTAQTNAQTENISGGCD